MTYDPRTYDLAGFFLQDSEEWNQRDDTERDKLKGKLACVIQRAIEEFICDMDG